MPKPNLFLDTQIFVDFTIPYRLKSYQCSKLLLSKISDGIYRGWTVDYVLSETLGELKGDLERKKHLDYLKREALSELDIRGLVKMIEDIKKIPNLEIFKAPVTEQREIYEKVKNLCIEAGDALILISTLRVREKLGGITLITRDERFLIRSKKEVPTAHPSEFMDKCPPECLSKNVCRFYK